MSLQVFKRFTMIACLVLFAAGCGGGGSTVPGAPPAGVQPASNQSAAGQVAASATTTSLSYTSSSYNQIVNPAPWPANFRPFAASSPWNIGTAGKTQNASLTAIIRDPSKPYTKVRMTWDWSGTRINGFGTGGEPAYLASTTDPQITMNCTTGCNVNPTDWSNNSQVSSLQIRIPAKARPATDYDKHLTVIQPDGEEVDCYQTPLPSADYVNGGRYSSQHCVETSITTGSGIIPHSSNAAGRVNTGGMIRYDEYQRGVIPHALYFFSGCSQGSIPPAQGSDNPGGVCGSSLPEGAWIHLALTDTQIAALPASAGNKAILTALAHYGGWLLDSAGSGTQSLMGSIAPCNQYAAYGQPCPWPTSGTVVDWPSLRNNLEILNYP